MDALAQTIRPLNTRRECPPGVPKLSVYDGSREEIAKHRWIECKHAGRDLGDTPVYDWVQKHWWGFLRAKWLEHLSGVHFWHELDHGDFGLLNTEFTQSTDLLNEIVRRLVAGEENLGLLLWAMETKQDLETVIAILEALDINSRRLVHRFDAL